MTDAEEFEEFDDDDDDDDDDDGADYEFELWCGVDNLVASVDDELVLGPHQAGAKGASLACRMHLLHRIESICAEEREALKRNADVEEIRAATLLLTPAGDARS
jgi:hypothetical protein